MTTNKSISDYKLAFFDLDGTLINSSGTLSEASKRSVEYLRSKGIRISLATGRAFFGAKDVISLISIADPCTFFSGALIIEPKSMEVIKDFYVPKERLYSLIDTCRKSSVYCELYTSNDYYVEADSPYIEIHQWYMKQTPKMASFDSIIGKAHILKAVIALQKNNDEHLLQALKQEFSDLTFGVATAARHPDIYFANITSSMATRENAFDVITSKLSVSPDEVISFGDAISDIPFLMRSGLGIAIGEAEKEVIDVADFISKSSDEDGIAYALNCLFNAGIKI